MAQLAVDTLNTEWAAAPGSDDGALLGRNTTSKVGFYGAVPVARPTIPASGATVQQLVDALAGQGLILKV